MKWFSTVIFILCVLFGIEALAQVVADPNADFFSQLVVLIQGFGGFSWMAKVAGGCLLIIAATKTSFLAPMWAKLPALVQTLAAPVLALIAGVVSMGSSLSLPAVLAYVVSGAGAVVMHEILDGVKGIPGIGSVYLAIISVLEGLFFKPKV